MDVNFTYLIYLVKSIVEPNYKCGKIYMMDVCVILLQEDQKRENITQVADPLLGLIYM